MTFESIDLLWLLVCAGLVLLMQAGFLCLEAGLTRSKNAVNVALKNLADLAITPLVFWGFGASLMFGISCGGLFGQTGLLSGELSGSLISFLVFQMMFCATASTIVSGAIAERMHFVAYLAVCVVVSGLTYPLVGHWVWGSTWSGTSGLLEARGFVDFAGSGVVHLTGGCAALAAALAVGPRLGRFDPEHLEMGFPKSSLPLAMLGALLLSVGWIGFNGGSLLRFDESVAGVILNTLLAGAAGGASSLAISRVISQTVAPEVVINGLLGGLVAVCASANVASPTEAMLVGAFAGAVCLGATLALVRFRIDDAIGAFPVHGVCGVLGLVALPLTAGAADTTSLGTQVLGALVIAAAAFFPTYLLLSFLLPKDWVRVSPEEEQRGLNLSEHGVESELHVLLRGLLEESFSTDKSIDTSDEAGVFAATVDRCLNEAFQQGEAATIDEANQALADEMRDYGTFLHAVLDRLEVQVCILDEESRIVETNRAWDRFVEVAGEHVNGEVGADFVKFCREGAIYGGTGPDELAAMALSVAADQLDDFTGEYPALIAGKQRLLEVRIKPLPTHQHGAVIVLQTDRTEERRSQRLILQEKQKAETLANALEASQASLELAMKGGELGLWHWDVASGYFELSGNWLKRLGCGAGQLNADVESFRELIHPDELVLWTRNDAASLMPEEPYDRQFRLRDADGTFRWVQVLGRANARNADGLPESLSGILLDINDRKADQLRDAGMAKIIEESLNEVYVVDLETSRFLEVNRGARENVGYTMEQLLEMTPSDLSYEMSEKDIDKLVRPLREGSEDRVQLETKHRRDDGTIYPCMLSLQKNRLMDREVIVAIGIDLSQRRELEAQLAAAQRLESIGQLAAGVAHEMNTPLQFVGNNMKFLNDCSDSLFEVIDAHQANLDPEADPKPWRERHEEINEAIERTRFARIRAEVPRAIEDSLEGVDRVIQIVRAMKDFSHPGDELKSPTDLNRAIESTVTVTRNRWKYAAKLVMELDPGLPHVTCKGGAINQVFVNLIVNAADAVAERREQEPDAPEGRIVVRSRLEGNQVVFEFEDSGCGMPEEVQRRIFDPFFTTKEVGKGTGQGLSLSHAIITQKHGGSITVHSTPGEGTLMRVVLPIESPSVDEAAPSELPREPAHS